MGDELSKDDQLELQRRRMAEQVQDNVEKVLVKRYTWLGIVVSLSIIAGVITSIVSLNKDANKKIAETEYLLDKSKKSVEEVDNISKTVKGRFEKLDKELAGVFAGKDASIDKLAQLTSQIEKLDIKVNNLVTKLNPSLEKQNLPKVSPDPEEKIQTQVKQLKDQLVLSKLTIYLQYYREEDQAPMNKIREFLKHKGYAVPKLELIKTHKTQYRDIRYFHDDEEGDAQRLKNDIEESLSKDKRADIKLNIENRSKAYPNVQKGIIEVWIYF